MKFADQVYWLNRMKECTKKTYIISDLVCQPGDLPSAQTLEYRLPQALSDGINRLGHHSSLSVFIIFTAVMKIMLYKYANEQDIVVGVPPYTSKESNHLLPLRTRMKLESTFREVVLQVKEGFLELVKHGTLSLSELVDLSGQSKSSSENPFFNIALRSASMQGQPSKTFSEGCFLQLEIDDDQTPMMIRAVYNENLYKDKSVIALLNQWVRIAETALKDPTAPISYMDELSDVERIYMLNNFYQPGSFTVDAPLHELFERQVLQTPDHQAVVYRNESLTYEELNRRANRLAHELISSGCTSRFVGILMERSADFLVAMLAILKAGKAFIPLDPTYPSERLEYMISHSQTDRIITEHGLGSMLPELFQNPLFIQQRMFYSEQSLESRNTCNPGRAVSILDSAYMIYTSGSTGLPKGAIIRHDGAVNHIYAQRECMKLTEQLVFLQSAPASSDISIWQFLAPLLLGGKTAIIEKETLLDPEKLFAYLHLHQVTMVEFVPSLLETLVDYAVSCEGISDRGTLLPDSLEWIMPTGETLSVRLLNALLVYFPSVKIANAYGPSEASDDTIQYITTQPLPENEARVSIGRPLPNVRILILDQNCKLLPIGMPGEIYVSGVAVGEGYWQDAQKTNECFMPNPYIPNEIMYRTGDAGRWLPSGDIDFLGRMDEQVKVRGYRVELGDIEAQIVLHPLVRQCVVVAKVPPGGGSSYLAAYLVPLSGESIVISKLQEELRHRLPQHMIPTKVFVLDSIPLTPSGKTDRQALMSRSDFDQEQTVQDSDLVAPRNELEELLHQLWLDTLQTNRIGIYDDFFHIGGDSIQSIQLSAKAKARGLQLTPKDIFDQLTIAKLAELLARRIQEKESRPQLNGPIPLTPIQRWFYDQSLAEPDHFNQAILLELDSQITALMASQVFTAIWEQHEALRMYFPPGDEIFILDKYLPKNEVPFTIVNLCEVPFAQRKEAIETQASRLQTSFSLIVPPLCKAVYFEEEEGRPPHFLLVMHHFIVDGVSWRIILDDLQSGFFKLLHKQELKLEEATASFADWSRMLKDTSARTELQEQLPFWSELLEQADRQGALDRFHELEPGKGKIHQRICVVSEETTIRLFQLLPRFFHARIHEVLLAVWMKVLYQVTGTSSLLLDMESHGRDFILDEMDVSRTVGWFTCLYPVFLERQDHWDYSDQVQHVRSSLARVPGNGSGYGLLRYLAAEGIPNMTANVFSQAGVRFNYLGQTDSVLTSDMLFKISQNSAGESIALSNQTRYGLDVNCVVFQGCLRFQLICNDISCSSEESERLVATLTKELEAIIDYCEARPLLPYSIFEFPQSTVRRSEIERIAAETLTEGIARMTLKDDRNNEAVKHQDFIEDIYPLTPMQNALLFHNIFYASQGLNIQQIHWLLRGELKVDAYRQAWQAVVDAHPVLRSSFRWRRLQEPVQIVYRTMPLHFEVEDWSQEDTSSIEKQLARYMKIETEDRFSPTSYPLIRFVLIHLAEDQNVFLIRYATSLFDNWSWRTLMLDVMEAYERAAAGQDAFLPVRRGFLDYVKWIRNGASSSTKHFWQKELSDLKWNEALQVKRADNGFKPQELDIAFTLAETESAEQMVKNYGVTMNSFLQTVWALLWCAYDSSPNTIYSVLSSGRTTEVPDMDKIVGAFSNLLPVSCGLGEGVLLSEWIRQVQDKQIEAVQHDYIAPEQLAEWTRIPIEVLQRAIYERGFIYIGDSDENYLRQLPARALEIVQVNSNLSHHIPLRAYGLKKDSLMLSIKYNELQYSQEEIQRMAADLKRLFSYVLLHIQQPISLTQVISSCIHTDKQSV